MLREQTASGFESNKQFPAMQQTNIYTAGLTKEMFQFIFNYAKQASAFVGSLIPIDILL